MIKRLTVQKLNGRSDFDLCFNEDMNVLTGKNGCGKTTLLKLAWYMVSGNLERILAEIDFEEAVVETDEFLLSVSIKKPEDIESKGKATWKIEANESIPVLVPANNAQNVPEQRPTRQSTSLQARRELEAIKSVVMKASGGSVFFPTFRRIEGGFSMLSPTRNPYKEVSYSSTTTKVEDAMEELSERLSEGRHRFVATISTRDIVDMITRRYAQISQRINRDNSNLSRTVTSMIGEYTPLTSNQSDAETVAILLKTLDEIKNLVSTNTSNQEGLLQPFTALGRLINQIFQYKAIGIAPGINLGDIGDVIPSDVLSAGEKQMLSFVAYNAFTRNSVIFIDEPEISLHVDWQRTLFSILESQGTNNQFIVATHSPFIYSKYADKEIALNSDRGE